MKKQIPTRMFLHVLSLSSASNAGLKNIIITTVDTDIIVLAIHFYIKLELENLWIGFGTGNKYHVISIRQYAENLGPIAEGLTFFHSFTGCDATSCFVGYGKISIQMA